MGRGADISLFVDAALTTSAWMTLWRPNRNTPEIIQSSLARVTRSKDVSLQVCSLFDQAQLLNRMDELQPQVWG